MKNIMIQLLESSGYKEVTLEPGITSLVYVNPITEDCIVFKEFTVEEISKYKEGSSAEDLSKVSLVINSQLNMPKDTSLIALVRIEGYAQYDTIQNSILSFEEDPYTYRKYTIAYTDSGVGVISRESDILKFCKDTINNQNLFDTFQKDSQEDYYRLVLDLFIKLPFLKLDESVKTLEAFEDISKKDDYKAVNNLSAKLAEGWDVNNVSDDEAIDILLNSTAAKGLLNEN